MSVPMSFLESDYLSQGWQILLDWLRENEAPQELIELFHGMTWVDHCKSSGTQPDAEYWIPALITSVEDMTRDSEVKS